MEIKLNIYELRDLIEPLLWNYAEEMSDIRSDYKFLDGVGVFVPEDKQKDYENYLTATTVLTKYYTEKILLGMVTRYK